MGGELVGVDLRKEFERLVAEAQHLPLATPMEGREEEVGVKEEEESEQEDESSRFLVEGSVSKTTPTPQQLACSSLTHVQQVCEGVWGGRSLQI